MSIRWNIEDAARGAGLWLVGEDQSWVHVVAPPGVHVVAAQYEPPDRPLISGWRHACWQLGEEDPLVDLDPPSALRELSTSEVVALVGTGCAPAVREVLVRQLNTALTFGQRHDGAVPDEEELQAASRAVAWLLSELRQAFPADSWELPPSQLSAEDVPDTSDQLLSRLGAPRIADVMTSDLPSVAPGDAVREAARRMNERNAKALPVCDEGRLVGIVTDWDVTRAVADAHDALERVVGDYMTTELVAVAPETLVADAADLMAERELHHVLVRVGDSFVGMFHADDAAPTKPSPSSRELEHPQG